MDSPKLTSNSQGLDYTKNLQLFFELCQNEIEHHAPRKKKYLCGNNKPFMTKALSKSIMERTHLRNNSLKNSSCCKQISLHKTKKLLCIISKKSKKEIYFKPKQKEYH